MPRLLSYNARRKDLHIQNGTILSYDQAMKISGESITRYGEDYITGQSIEFTHCLGTPPDWSIAADELEIPVGGYGNAKMHGSGSGHGPCSGFRICSFLPISPVTPGCLSLNSAMGLIMAIALACQHIITLGQVARLDCDPYLAFKPGPAHEKRIEVFHRLRSERSHLP